MIRIVSLTDNLSGRPELKAKHGLALYIETSGHKILFDTGPDSTFLKNAEKLGIDLAAVDTVIISHGHYDHGGGLEAFLKINSRAAVYIRKPAFDPYYTRVLGISKYIGLSPSLKDHPNLFFTDEYLKIDGELALFSGVTERKLFSEANGSLFVKEDGNMVPDSFRHEQYLIIRDGEKQVLITGCSHTGIVNIVEKFNREYRAGTDVTVIGGFHLYDIARKKYEKDEVICAVSDELKALGGAYYTCHCTGKHAYDLMKDRMTEKLSYLSVGREVIIE